jgi:FkbM family methyltransferase
VSQEPQTPPQQLQWYRESLPLEGQVIADVGANVGVLSAFFWEASRGTSRVISVEPVAGNVEQIRGRIARSGAERWVVEACAVSGEDGELALRVEEQPEGGWNSVAAAGGALRVPARRLSGLIPEATVVKLDIEGHEYPVLDEALPRMKQVVAWAIEFHGVEGRPLEQALGKLAAAGYELAAAGRRAGDPGGAWVSAAIPPTLSWAQIPPGRGRDGAPFRMLHVLARRR